MATFGNLFDNFWHHLAAFGNFWLMLATYGNLWQLLSTYGNLLWFRLMCSWRLDGWMMGFSQRVFHEWFSPVCVLRWCFTDLEPENFFSQNLQENGFSPV